MSNFDPNRTATPNGGESTERRKKNISWGYVEEDVSDPESHRIKIDSSPQRLPPPRGEGTSSDAGVVKPKKQSIMSADWADSSVPPPPLAADAAYGGVQIAAPKSGRSFLSLFFGKSSAASEPVRQVL